MARSLRLRSRLRPVAVAAALLTASAGPAAAGAGELDRTFGVDGTLRTNFGGTYDWAYAAAVQPDGKIIAAGVSNAAGTYDFAVARYTPDRALDESFGDGGIVTTDFGASRDWAYAVALQPNGRIVVAGVSDHSGSKDFALTRYTPDGRLDPTFGDDGRVSGGLRPLTADMIHGVAVQPDGGIVAAGVSFEDRFSVKPHGDFMVARYTPEGELDPTFGVGGVVTTNFAEQSYDIANAVVLQSNGRILVGGVSNSGGGPGVLYGADQWALARYTPGGLLDPTFGERGRSVVDLGTLDEEIRALALTSDGRIIAAGVVDGENRGNFAVARFKQNGFVDHSFGSGGGTVTDLGTNSERLDAVALQPDGRIVAGGQVARQGRGDFAVVRYEADGRLDSGFGQGGVAAVDFAGRDDRGNALALSRDGKVVIVGASEDDFALARFDL